MLDVHPPHEATHSWKDFFIHIATIVVGLLIAVGLEQSVEAIQHHRERRELRESLQNETEQILRDTTRVERSVTEELAWYRQVDVMLIDSAKTHHAIGQLPAKPRNDFDVPDDPVYAAAKASGKLGLLSQNETEAYGEMNVLLEEVKISYNHREESLRSMIEAQHLLAFGLAVAPAAQPNSFNLQQHGYKYSGLTLTQTDLTVLYTNDGLLETSSSEFRYWSRQARGAAMVMKEGERNLRTIETAERQFDRLP